MKVATFFGRFMVPKAEEICDEIGESGFTAAPRRIDVQHVAVLAFLVFDRRAAQAI